MLFAFHGSINRDIRPGENGNFHGETRIKTNGYWVYENREYQFRAGDVLNFWLYVQHENLGYRLEDQRYVYPGKFKKETNILGLNFFLKQISVVLRIFRSFCVQYGLWIVKL